MAFLDEVIAAILAGDGVHELAAACRAWWLRPRFQGLLADGNLVHTHRSLDFKGQHAGVWQIAPGPAVPCQCFAR